MIPAFLGPPKAKAASSNLAGCAIFQSLSFSIFGFGQICVRYRVSNAPIHALSAAVINAPRLLLAFNLRALDAVQFSDLTWR